MRQRQRKALSEIGRPRTAPFEYEFLYAPLGDSGAYAYLEPWYGFSVSKDSDEAELAVEFLRFMATRLGEMAGIKGLPPSRRTAPTSYAGIRHTDAAELSFTNDGRITETVRNASSSLVAISARASTRLVLARRPAPSYSRADEPDFHIAAGVVSTRACFLHEFANRKYLSSPNQGGISSPICLLFNASRRPPRSGCVCRRMRQAAHDGTFTVILLVRRLDPSSRRPARIASTGRE